MDPISLNDICVDLEAERDRLVARSQALRDELCQAEAARKRVEAALKALGSKSATKPVTRRPSPAKADVFAVILQILQKRGSVEEAALRAETEQRIVKAGKSRMGLALRFKEALADDRFELTSEGYRLVQRESGNGEKPKPPERQAVPE